MAKILDKEEIDSMEALRSLKGKSEIIDAIRAFLSGKRDTGKNNGFEWIKDCEDVKPTVRREFHEYRYRGLAKPCLLDVWYRETEDEVEYTFYLNTRVIDRDKRKWPTITVEKRRRDNAYRCHFNKSSGRDLSLSTLRKGLKKYGEYMQGVTDQIDGLLEEYGSIELLA